MSQINVGAVFEALNNKADRDFQNSNMIDYVIEYQAPTAQNNYTWYRLYKSGWVEQGGSYQWDSVTSNRVTITYPIQMANAINFISVTRPKGIGDTNAYNNDGVESQSTTGFISAGYASGNAVGNSFVWEVKGMAA